MDGPPADISLEGTAAPTSGCNLHMDERHHANIHDRAALYKSAFESANDVIIYYHYDPKDENGPRILHANAKFVEETGYDLEEVVGRHSNILFGAETNMRMIEANRKKLYEGEPVVSEMRKYMKNGDAYWTEASVYPLRDTFGRFTFWISVERNITARRELEDQTRLLRLALESAGDGVVINVVSTDTGAPWNITYCNAAFEAMTGWNRSELETLEKVFGPAPNREQSERARKAILAGETVRVQNAFFRKDGTEFWVEGVIQPVLGEDERPLHSITIYREIAEPLTASVAS